MTLEKQYKRYVRETPINPMTYKQWLEDFGKKINEAIEKANKRDEDQLPGSINETLYDVVSNLGKAMDSIKYYGDISDLGNEIGYAVGNTVKNMTERETRHFIFGIQHGISLTNGTH
jgi:hypothetical protein